MDIIIKGGAVPSTSFGVPLTPLIVDPTFGAGRVTLKPDEFNSGAGFNGGHYRLATTTGALTGTAAGNPIFSCRAPAVGFLLLKRVQVTACVTTAFTTAQAIDFDAIKVTGFTASDTGGTTLTPAAQTVSATNKKRTGLMSSSQVVDMRIATTGTLTAGTRTLDSFPFGAGAALGVTNTLGSAGFVDLYKQDEDAEHPMLFAPNEGFLVRTVTAMGATGVLKVYVTVDWAEVPGL